MSTNVLTVEAKRQARRRVQKWVVALVLAAALTSLPVLASGPLSFLFADAVYAGCNLGGTCG